jgi:uncharacterized protein (DUF488 family)
MIYTIGHSTHDADTFIGLLKQHRVCTLVDVRSLPGSRRYPHFNQECLADTLASVGITYTHLPSLGGHRRATKDGGFETVRNQGMRGYAQYTASSEFRDGVEQLLTYPVPGVMCAEAVWWRCHRRMIAEALVMGAYAVRHIMPNGSLVEPRVDLLEEKKDIHT